MSCMGALLSPVPGLAGVLKRRHEQRLGIELKAAAVPVRESDEEASPEASEA